VLACKLKVKVIGLLVQLQNPWFIRFRVVPEKIQTPLTGGAVELPKHCDGSATTKDNAVTQLTPNESVALTYRTVLMTVPGVPERRPVPLRVTPDGNDPEISKKA
jgi:hypothetical protein